MPKEPKDLERHVCFNMRGNDGRVMDVLSLAKGAEEQTVIARGCLTTSNAQRALHHRTPIQALKAWREKKPELFVKRVYEQTGLDT